jgi:hypothetical protein
MVALAVNRMMKGYRSLYLRYLNGNSIFFWISEKANVYKDSPVLWQAVTVQEEP